MKQGQDHVHSLLETNVGVGLVRHHRRTGRARKYHAVLCGLRPASDTARARQRRGDSGREPQAVGGAGAGGGGVSERLDAPEK